VTHADRSEKYDRNKGIPEDTVEKRRSNRTKRVQDAKHDGGASKTKETKPPREDT
jgi:hypothetical protein